MNRCENDNQASKHESGNSDLPIMRNDAQKLTVRSASLARVVKLVDTLCSERSSRETVPVRVRPRAQDNGRQNDNARIK